MTITSSGSYLVLNLTNFVHISSGKFVSSAIIFGDFFNSSHYVFSSNTGQIVMSNTTKNITWQASYFSLTKNIVFKIDQGFIWILDLNSTNAFIGKLESNGNYVKNFNIQVVLEFGSLEVEPYLKSNIH